MIGKLNSLDSAIYLLENAVSASFKAATYRLIIRDTLKELYQVRQEKQNNDNRND
jgi:hypothetical protein